MFVCQAFSTESQSVRMAENMAIGEGFNRYSNQTLTQSVSDNRMCFLSHPQTSLRVPPDEVGCTNHEARVMCLAIPARIIELDGDKAVVDAMGNSFKAKTTLLPQVKVGDLVLIHAGFAISMVDEEEAKKTWELLAQIADFEETPNKVSG